MNKNGAVISKKEAYPVRIGALLMYCENFRAVGTRNFSEKTTVSGGAFFANSGKRALRLTFEGRIYDEYLPLRMLLYTDAFLTSGSSCTIKYRGLTFTGCRVQSFTAEDGGEDYLKASITLVTVNTAKQSEAANNDG